MTDAVRPNEMIYDRLRLQVLLISYAIYPLVNCVPSSSPTSLLTRATPISLMI